MAQFQGMSFRPTRSSIPDTPVSRTPMRSFSPSKSKLSSFTEGAMRGLQIGQRQEAIDFEKQKYDDDIKYREKKYKADQDYRMFSQAIDMASQIKVPKRKAEYLGLVSQKIPAYQDSLKTFTDSTEQSAMDYKKLKNQYDTAVKKNDFDAAEGISYQMLSIDEKLAEKWLTKIGKKTKETKEGQAATAVMVYRNTLDKIEQGELPEEQKKEASLTLKAIEKKHPKAVMGYLEDRDKRKKGTAGDPTSKMKDAAYLKTQGFTDKEANSIAYDISQGEPRKALQQKLITAIMTKQQPEEFTDKQLDRVPKILDRIFGKGKSKDVEGKDVEGTKGVFTLPDGSTATQADIDFTAKKYDMTIEEVKTKLGVK